MSLLSLAGTHVGSGDLEMFRISPCALKSLPDLFWNSRKLRKNSHCLVVLCTDFMSEQHLEIQHN